MRTTKDLATQIYEFLAEHRDDRSYSHSFMFAEHIAAMVHALHDEREAYRQYACAALPTARFEPGGSVATIEGVVGAVAARMLAEERRRLDPDSSNGR